MNRMEEDQYVTHYTSEICVNMNGGAKQMIGPAHKLNHYAVIGQKAVKHTSLTERKNDTGPNMDVTMNFSRLPKSFNQPQPNNAGQPVEHTLYKKSAAAGKAKGGIRNGKG